MPSLFQAINRNTRFSEEACRRGVHAMADLVQARLALFTVEEAGLGGVARMRAHEAFSQQQEMTRKALRPLIGFSPKAVGEVFYQQHWQLPLENMGRTFKSAFGHTPDGKEEVVGFNLTELVNADYRPTRDSLVNDIAVRTMPIDPPSTAAPRSQTQTWFNFEWFAEREAEARMQTSKHAALRR